MSPGNFLSLQFYPVKTGQFNLPQKTHIIAIPKIASTVPPGTVSTTWTKNTVDSIDAIGTIGTVGMRGAAN